MRIAAIKAPVAFQAGWGETWTTSTCVVRTPDGAAAALKQRLADANVDSRDWWGAGLHREPAFERCLRDALPVTEMLAVSTLGLPYYADMTDDEVRAVGRALGV